MLAVDPSPAVSGGSILGDKTRMERLSVHERAFIRPSPSGGTLGGVADGDARGDAASCEAAGYDVVIVETVGVGQSETAVAGMTDMFVLLQLPNAGDDLQAIKKGVMELADLVVINKADLDPAAAARAVGQIESALQLARSREGASRAAARARDAARSTRRQVRAVWRRRRRLGGASDAPAARIARRRAAPVARLAAGADRRRPGASDSAPTRGSGRCWPATLAAVDAGRLPVSVAARTLLRAFESCAGFRTCRPDPDFKCRPKRRSILPRLRAARERRDDIREYGGLPLPEVVAVLGTYQSQFKVRHPELTFVEQAQQAAAGALAAAQMSPDEIDAIVFSLAPTAFMGVADADRWSIDHIFGAGKPMIRMTTPAAPPGARPCTPLTPFPVARAAISSSSSSAYCHAKRSATDLPVR